MGWEDWLRFVICEIYKAWGGDCKNLGGEPTVWINTVTAELEANGAPTFADQAAEDAFLDLLSQLETGLQSPNNALAQADTDRLKVFIDTLRSLINP